MVGALQQLKILDLTSLWPGPLATMLLADLGAEVLRVDALDRPDMLRFMPPLTGDGQAAAWHTVARNKRSIGLNLKTAAGRSLFQELLQTYDIVVEQFRPGVLDRLGVGYAAMSASQPRLIWCAISAFGQTGPLRDRPGHDINFLALSGAAHHMGGRGGAPHPWTTVAGDTAGGTWPAVAGILAAALHRSATGLGQFVDISMADGALFLNAMPAAAVLAGAETDQAEHGVLGGDSAYGFYATRDGRWVSMAALEPKFWADFCAAVHRPDLLDWPGATPAEQQALRHELTTIFAGKTWAEWRHLFQDVPCCVEVVLDTAEALAAPQVAARQMVVALPQPDGNSLTQLGNPLRLLATPPTLRTAARTPGADTDQVLRELGKTPAEIAELRASGAVGSE